MGQVRHTAGTFWAHAAPQANGCWYWDGRANNQGYGRLTFQGKQALTHRVAWQLSRGPIPPRMFVCHTCDEPRCVNPEHLFLGSPLDNIRDASRKNRMHPGVQHGMAKLTDEDVSWARRRAALGDSGVLIAKALRIHPNTVYNILKGRTWRHVV